MMERVRRETGREGGRERGGVNVSFDSSDVNPATGALPGETEDGGREGGGWEGKDENTGRRSHTSVERRTDTHTLPVYVFTLSIY